MAWNPNVPTVTNRVQDDLNAIRENFQHLDPLAPYVQAILGSRIVDHNLDVANPPNGYYVRWANGLQLVFGRVNIGSIAINTAWGNIFINSSDVNLPWPAGFKSLTSPPQLWVEGSQSAWVINSGSPSSIRVSFRLARGISQPAMERIVLFSAIGLWEA